MRPAAQDRAGGARGHSREAECVNALLEATDLPEHIARLLVSYVPFLFALDQLVGMEPSGPVSVVGPADVRACSHSKRPDSSSDGYYRHAVSSADELTLGAIVEYTFHVADHAKGNLVASTAMLPVALASKRLADPTHSMFGRNSSDWGFWINGSAGFELPLRAEQVVTPVETGVEFRVEQEKVTSWMYHLVYDFLDPDDFTLTVLRLSKADYWDAGLGGATIGGDALTLVLGDLEGYLQRAPTVSAADLDLEGLSFHSSSLTERLVALQGDPSAASLRMSLGFSVYNPTTRLELVHGQTVHSREEIAHPVVRNLLLERAASRRSAAGPGKRRGPPSDAQDSSGLDADFLSFLGGS